ncbi:MR-MLE family protein [Oribacterium sp. C9]|uniref:mandelate racemase/muconate lactonizing enzyme family protein n=1 Tax=Oribacterium sp. C9 TaxID=1943579 RepID=UPI00098FEA7C|nr:mandelate racemase/muconate lactonizing enzyme family protein [Oribacterium sp. C9]OON86797.1 MR-MLE family protein [Oribacterium sp. C9]
MKITNIDIMALEKDLGCGGSRPIICKIYTDEGIYGIGEAAIAIACGSRGAFEVLKDFAPMIIGMDAMAHEVIWEKLFKCSFWAQGNGAVMMAAISAIDTALWDIKGKAANMPLYQLLGGKQREKLRTYASQLQFGWGVDSFNPADALHDPQEYAEAALKAKEQGYTAIKINFLRFDKNGKMLSHLDTTSHLSRETMKTAEARLRAVREAVGPDMDILIENHAMTDANTAIQFAHMAEPYDIMFLEEGCTPLNPAVMRKIADKTSIPLATGERTYTRWGFLPFLENHSLSLIQPDIGNCGGITEAKKICDMAHIFDVGAQMHVCSSPISVAIALHLEAAIPNFIIHEHHIANTTSGTIRECLYDYQPENGYFSVPELPGIGQDLSQYAIDHAETVKF